MTERYTLENYNKAQDLEVSLKEMEDEYLSPFLLDELNAPKKGAPRISPDKISSTLRAEEKKLVSEFLSTPCPCGEDCGRLFSVSEVCESRENFRSMTWREQHSFIVAHRENEWTAIPPVSSASCALI